MNNIKVSVCIPVFGVEKYIEKCARTLFEQTLQEIEYIFVDDCTPDRSIKILQKVLEEYPHRKEQVKIIHHEKNMGLVAARNTALKYVSGEYVIHCDSDDWVEVNMYETMYNKAKEVNADMVYCDYILEYGDEISKLKECAIYDDASKMLEDYPESCTYLVTSMYKKNIAQNENIVAPEHICLQEDTLRILQMYNMSSTVVKCDGESFFYHYLQKRSGSYTNNYKKEYFLTSCEIPDILIKHLPTRYWENILIFKGNTLFNAIKHDVLSCKEFNGIWYKDRKDIIFCKRVAIIKKIVLLLAFVNYCSTAKLCKFSWSVCGAVQNVKLMLQRFMIKCLKKIKISN